MVGQPSGDGRHECRADDGSQVVADAGAGITHVGVEQLRQERADRTECGAHQREADAQEQQVGGEVTLADDRRIKQEREEQCECHEAAGRDDDHALAAEFIGVHAGNDDERGEHADGKHQHEQVFTIGETKVAAALLDGFGAPSEGPGCQRVEQRVGDGHQERGLDDFLPALLEHFGQRRLDDLLLFLSHAEDRGLLHLHAHHKTDDHQHCGQQERHTPTPCQHRIVIVERFQQEVSAVRQEETDRSTQFREGAIQRTLVFRSVLGGHQSGTRPFAAQTNALYETAQA